MHFTISSKQNPISSGNTIEIHGIKNGDKWINLKGLHISGNYVTDEESIYLLPSSSGIDCRIKAVDELIINFRSRPDAGIVEIISKEGQREIDLYSERIEEIPLSLKFPIPRFVVLFSLLLYSYSLGYLAFFIPVLILAPYLSDMDESKKITDYKLGNINNLLQQILQKLKKYHLLSNLLVPIFILSIYCGSIAFINAQLLIKGVTYYFINNLWFYGTIFIIGLYLVIYVISELKNNSGKQSNFSIEKVEASDLVLLLLPLTPVVQYIINNQDFITFLDSLFLVGFFILFSGIYIFAIPAVFNKISSTQKMMTLGLALTFTITNMASLSHSFSWFEQGNFQIQILYFLFIFIASWLLFNGKNKKIFLFFIALYFITNSGHQLLLLSRDSDKSKSVIEDNRLLSLIGEKRPVKTPNIYFSIYDSYVSNEVMLGYGIDNSTQESYLRDQGFVLYPHTYSIAASTQKSISSVLNMMPNSNNPRGIISGDGIVLRTLKSLGYKTYGIFPWDGLLRGTTPKYDFTLPERVKPPYISMIWSVLIGEFRFDIDFQTVTQAKFIETKQSIINNHTSENPIFVYSHSLRPVHSQNSGTCLTNEIELYKERLDLANLDMMQEINSIIANDPEAIIIVAGDHGPYLTKNCIETNKIFDISEISRLDIQDRYGTFLAIRWPTIGFANYDEITILQDLFPAIFAYIYEDANFLELKMEPSTKYCSSVVSGAEVNSGIIVGGIDNGEPLFILED